MRNIAVTILALVALAFGCKVGDPMYCHEAWGDSPEEKYVSYGGPESKIREKLNDPCDGAEITAFAFVYRGRDGDRFDLYCGYFKYRITPDSLELFIGYDRAAIDYGDKAKYAWESASRVAKIITELSGKIGWNP